ncbi:cysteine desulfurase [Massilia sp. Root418]|jgi:cysteine sulfinate desulfinase/cysteine desulfurase-like protein/rhodanese-related sulfurtransferase|uniref:aminotransferase class V-fold PLP-dependent enzyme n=1 Tax=Massilia sp. Root418 TaxID=1736532 RepID=UPI0006F8921A|nr:aminotransferase class V-fold PLP-dependent enzyme [Massilia sp. Root418]KQX00215.1 cysteine desulfurase [Massilia sp. Root418]
MTSDIYLDGNATSPVLPAAIAAAVRAMEDCYGNPSSTHTTGLRARALLDGARQRAVRLLGVEQGRLMFNSGATEGIQTAVLSALCALRERRDAGEAIGALLVYGATEHKAVPEALAHWNRLLGLNLTLSKLPVDSEGRHDLQALRALLPQAAMLCTMAANNETGVLSDIAGIEALLDEAGSSVYWMVDCVQALGKFRLRLARSRIDYAPFSGHKLYAPKGIGMLYVREGAPFTPLIVGGGQEGAQRSGTENMAGVAALDAVLAALEQGGVFRPHDVLCAFRERLAASLRRALPGVLFNAPFEHALPTTLNFSVPGLSSKELMDVFDAAGVRVSSGSACSAAKAAPSYVLQAMGVPDWRAASAIRMSFGPLADEASIARACERIERCGAALRASGLIAPDGSLPAQDGVLQLGSGGACSWLLHDAASRSCVVIDPQPEFAERIAAHVRGLGYRVRAVLGTSPGADVATLSRALNVAPGADAFGWPQDGNGNGDGGGELLALGGLALRRVLVDSQQAVYLLGEAAHGALPAAVRHAFIGTLAPQQVAGLVHADTLLCAASDARRPFCSTLRALEADQAACGDQAQGQAQDGDLHLDAAALQELLRRHPDAVLIDVRESHEHLLGVPAPLEGNVLSVPLGQLAGQIPAWLDASVPVPLVFFCRSGNRSTRAAQCLRRLGYAQAYDLAGGMALQAPAPHALALAA